MKKNYFLRFSIFIILIIIVGISYLSIVGIETNKFNDQISKTVKSFNKDFEIKTKKIQLILDPFNLRVNVKTIGPILIVKSKIIDLENVKTNVSIKSIIKKEFSLTNLEISTKSIEIKNLISFLRQFKDGPQLYVLEKIIKKGYLIADINLNFDSEGKIQNNFKIKGFIKDTKLKILKNYNFEKVNLAFNLDNNSYRFSELKLLINNIPLSSDRVIIKKVKDVFFVEGSFDNEKIELLEKNLQFFTKLFFPKFKVNKINLSSKNKFSFKMSKKFKIDNFKLSSKIELHNLKIINKLKLKNFFPNFRSETEFINHIIDINYHKDNLSIRGNGNISLQNKQDTISYEIKKKDLNYYFETIVFLEKNPAMLEIFNYKKNKNTKAELKIKGSHLVGKETIIKSFSYIENNNRFEVTQLKLDTNFKVKEFKKINLDYLDNDLRKNEVNLIRRNNEYKLFGPKFNADKLIQFFIDNKNNNKTFISKDKINLNVNINQVYLNRDDSIHNFIGDLSVKKNKISEAQLEASFTKSKKFKFTISTNQVEKVTTLFLDKAEPIISRYKFIKGFKGGSLDFYSIKKGNRSDSNLKIYDFKLKELPVLTKLLTLASLQGIADILSGEGISFDEFEMNFQSKDDLITINEIYAIGPAISILMDGYVEKNKLVSLRGSLVPATTINKAIGSIPILGKILVGTKTGEGVFGVSFKIKGNPKNLETTVNPIKTLTPRFITRTLEKIKK